MTELNDICPACGAELRAGAAFCFNCGKSIEELSAPPPPAEADAEAVVDVETAPLKVRPASQSPKRPQRLARKAAAIEWTAPEEGPGARFVLGAAAIGLLASLVFLVALYLK